MDKITGVELLDDLLKDSLPEGSSILVYGPPGSGIELFAKQFANVESAAETVYVATEESTKNVHAIREQMKWSSPLKVVNFGEEYYEKVLARRLDVSKYREEGIHLDDVKEFTASQYESGKSTNFLTKLIYETSKLSSGFRLVVDSLSFFLEHYEPASVLTGLRTIRAYAQRNNGTILVTLHGNPYQHTMQSGLEGLVDCIIELETNRVDGDFQRNIIVHKISNHPEKTGIMRYEIGSSGIQVTV